MTDVLNIALFKYFLHKCSDHSTFLVLT